MGVFTLLLLITPDHFRRNTTPPGGCFKVLTVVLLIKTVLLKLTQTVSCKLTNTVFYVFWCGFLGLIESIILLAHKSTRKKNLNFSHKKYDQIANSTYCPKKRIKVFISKVRWFEKQNQNAWQNDGYVGECSGGKKGFRKTRNECAGKLMRGCLQDQGMIQHQYGMEW